MAEISRRALLLAGTAILVAPATSAAARAFPNPPPSQIPPVPAPGSGATAHTGQVGAVAITVSLRNEDNNTAFAVTLVNGGATDETITVTITDTQDISRIRSPDTIFVPAGEARATTYYGHLEHLFLLRFCEANGPCTTIGPFRAQYGGGMPRSRTPELRTVPPGVVNLRPRKSVARH